MRQTRYQYAVHGFIDPGYLAQAQFSYTSSRLLGNGGEDLQLRWGGFPAGRLLQQWRPGNRQQWEWHFHNGYVLPEHHPISGSEDTKEEALAAFKRRALKWLEWAHTQERWPRWTIHAQRRPKGEPPTQSLAA